MEPNRPMGPGRAGRRWLRVTVRGLGHGALPATCPARADAQGRHGGTRSPPVAASTTRQPLAQTS
jgi:hypothetical protein